MSAATSSSAPQPTIYDLSPPYGKVTDNDHGPYVVICAWVMMCFFTISVLTRLLTRVIPVVVAGIDDVLCGVAMLFAIAQTAVIHVSARHGLGQRQDELSSASFSTYAKTYYTANILYIFTVYFAKASIVFLIKRLSPFRTTHRLCYGLLGIISIWAIAETFVFAFQCSVPSPWNYTGTCVSLSAMYYTEATFDIITDLAVIVLPAWVIWGVQIPLRKRLAVIAVFSGRIVVVICSACRIGFLHTYLDSRDKSWNAVTPQTWLQIIQCLSIITACLPCLKPFLESLESGFMDMSMKPHTGATYGSGRQNYGGGGKRKTNNNSYVMSNLSSHDRHTKEGTNIAISPVQAEHDINAGHYLDMEKSRHASRERSGSVPESERVLTSHSSDGYNHDGRAYDFSSHGNGSSGEGIRVTREVDIREEARGNDSVEVRHQRGW